MKYKRGFVIILCAVLASCAAQPEKIGNSVWPKVNIKTTSKKATGFILSKMMQTGASLDKQTENSLYFDHPIQGFRADMMQATFGCASCDQPKEVVEYIIVDTSDTACMVTAQFWSEVQQPNGTWQKIGDTPSNADYNTIQRALNGMKQQLESSS